MHFEKVNQFWTLCQYWFSRGWEKLSLSGCNFTKRRSIQSLCHIFLLKAFILYPVEYEVEFDNPVCKNKLPIKTMKLSLKLRKGMIKEKILELVWILVFELKMSCFFANQGRKM